MYFALDEESLFGSYVKEILLQIQNVNKVKKLDSKSVLHYRFFTMGHFFIFFVTNIASHNFFELWGIFHETVGRFPI